MMKLSRFGAAALAIALSVTFVNPTVALAKTERSVQLQYAGSFVDEDDVIDADVVNLGDISATGADRDEAEENAEKKYFETAVTKGLATTTKPAEILNPNSRTIDGKTYYYENLDYDDWDYDDDGAGTWTYVFQGVKGVIYKNRITGKTSIFREEVNSNFIADEATAYQFQKAIRIRVGETTYLGIGLKGGDTKINGIKSSKKAVATAKIYNKMGTETTSNDDLARIEPVYDNTSGNFTYTVYYETTVGGRVVVGTYDDYDKAVAARKTISGDASSAYKYIALNAKKKGKTKLTFTIVNNNGKTTKVTTTVYVVDDPSALKTFSYAGLSLLKDHSNSKNINYNRKEEDGYLWDSTTKKSGKLVVKANPNYQIKKIEVGALYDEAWSEGLTDKDQYGNPYSDNYSAYSRSGVKTTHKVDLNNDGDYEDTVDGMSESAVTFKYTTVKSGKRIKLSKVCSKSSETANSTSGTFKTYKNSKGEIVTFSTQAKSRGFMAPTNIRVTYYDKLSKTYGVTEKTIYLIVKK